MRTNLGCPCVWVVGCGEFMTKERRGACFFRVKKGWLSSNADFTLYFLFFFFFSCLPCTSLSVEDLRNVKFTLRRHDTHQSSTSSAANTDKTYSLTRRRRTLPKFSVASCGRQRGSGRRPSPLPRQPPSSAPRLDVLREVTNPRHHASGGNLGISVSVVPATGKRACPSPRPKGD